MPHNIRESHIDDICASCRQSHGNHIELIPQHHKIYKLITCDKCGYKMMKVQEEQFLDKYRFM